MIPDLTLEEWADWLKECDGDGSNPGALMLSLSG